MGARITSRIFFGGWLYPDVVSLAAAGAAAAIEEVDVNVDCAAVGTHAAPATSTAVSRSFNAFWIIINFSASTS
jgi:hypothetical protein